MIPKHNLVKDFFSHLFSKKIGTSIRINIIPDHNLGKDFFSSYLFGTSSRIDIAPEHNLIINLLWSFHPHHLCAELSATFWSFEPDPRHSSALCGASAAIKRRLGSRSCVQKAAGRLAHGHRK